jgi:hypothetical protein
MAFPVNLKSTYVGNAGNPVTLSNGDQRRALSAAFAGLGTAFGVGGGVTRHGDTSLAVTVDGSDNVTVQAGAVVIPGDAVAGTGCYLSALGAATTNALAARDATNPRMDLIVFRQMDTDVVGSHGAYTARIDTVVGTPSATPAAPTKPSMAGLWTRRSVRTRARLAVSWSFRHRRACPHPLRSGSEPARSTPAAAMSGTARRGSRSCSSRAARSQLRPRAQAR